MGKTVYITRRETFAAAHRMFIPELTDEENYKLFGKCSNPNWHGHNYVMWVTVKGEVNPETGYVVNLKEGVLEKAELSLRKMSAEAA